MSSIKYTDNSTQTVLYRSTESNVLEKIVMSLDINERLFSSERRHTNERSSLYSTKKFYLQQFFKNFDLVVRVLIRFVHNKRDTKLAIRKKTDTILCSKWQWSQMWTKRMRFELELKGNSRRSTSQSKTDSNRVLELFWVYERKTRKPSQVLLRMSYTCNTTYVYRTVSDRYEEPPKSKGYKHHSVVYPITTRLAIFSVNNGHELMRTYAVYTYSEYANHSYGLIIVSS